MIIRKNKLTSVTKVAHSNAIVEQAEYVDDYITFPFVPI